MGCCSQCGSSNCSCGTISPTYPCPVDFCVEDHCQKIYQAQYAFSLCPTNSWNVPLVGQAAVLDINGIIGIATGAYLWAPTYGYFQVISINVDRGQITIVNTGVEGNASPGVQIPKCTCFVVTDPPASTPQDSDLFPFVAIDFTAPAETNCIDITVTTLNTLQVGDTIQIGTGVYTIDAFSGGNIINICNNGLGLTPGTPVIAQDSSGDYVYPINVIGSCCSEISSNTATATSATLTFADPTQTGTTVPATLTLINPSASKTMTAIVSYIANYYFEIDAGGTGSSPTTFNIQTSTNGGSYTTVLPFPFTQKYLNTQTSAFKQLVETSVHSIAPGATLTIAGKAILTGNSANPIFVTASLNLQMKAMLIAL